MNKLIKYFITIIALVVAIVSSYFVGFNTSKNETLQQTQRNEELIRQHNSDLELRMKTIETNLESRLKYERIDYQKWK